MDNVHLIVFAAVLAVAVGYAVVFTEADANALVQIVPFKHKTPFKAKCLSVAQTYQLSPRETEIALLIAQGRDSAHIEKKLFLSRSTVQTHRMHLYQKLDTGRRRPTCATSTRSSTSTTARSSSTSSRPPRPSARRRRVRRTRRRRRGTEISGS